MPGALTRSRIEAFDQTATALSQAATRWRTEAERWQQAAAANVAQMNAPNGTEWQGQAAESAFQMAHTDQLSVSRAVEHAHGLADVAERGSDSLLGARGSALEAIAQAEDNNFTVGEDLSVTDNHSLTAAERIARQPAALEHASYIAHCAGRLDADDARIAGQLQAGAGEMTGIIPAQWQQHGAQVQLVDNKFKQDGGSVPQPQPPWDTPPAGKNAATGQWQLDTSRGYDSPTVPQGPYPAWRPTTIPEKVATGPSTGLVTTDQTGLSGTADGLDLQQAYKFRITGDEFSGITKMVQGGDGRWYLARWMDNTYEMQISKVLQGTGDLGGITSYPITMKWTPVSLAQIADVSAMYPNKTFYLPDGCGGTIPIVGGKLSTPTVPVMTAAH